MAASGMITRHFEHPSGATATLEMPAGWSRNCWYELRIHNPHAKDPAAIHANDRKTFQTPDEARAGAVARERLALANGWKPRMAAMPQNGSAKYEAAMFRTTGERIAVDIVDVTIHNEWPDRVFNGKMGVGVIQRTANLDVRADEPINIDPGYRILLRVGSLKSQTLMAAIIHHVGSSEMCQARIRYLINCDITALEPGEEEAVEQWSDREAIIAEGIEGNFGGLVDLRGWLSLRVKDSSERTEIQAAIIRGRAERQARLQRERELREASDRDALRRQILAQAERTSRPIIRVTAERERQTREQQTDEALRRLSGGVDLNKPKKRKIDLGE